VPLSLCDTANNSEPARSAKRFLRQHNKIRNFQSTSSLEAFPTLAPYLYSGTTSQVPNVSALVIRQKDKNAEALISGYTCTCM